MSEKTEPPTDHKLRELRDKGNVPRSKDFTKAAMLVAFLIYLMFAGPILWGHMVGFFLLTARIAYTPFDSALAALLNAMFDELVGTFVLLTIMVLLIGIMVEVGQTGGLIIAADKVKINFENLDFVKKAQQIFSKKNLIEFFKSIFKVALMTIVLWYIVNSNLGNMASLPWASSLTLLSVLIHTLWQLLAATTFVFILFGVPDLLLQRALFMSENKMSKEDIFREYKQSEGDPHIKHQRKHLHQEISAGDGGGGGHDASAVVVNPTHVAVALYYNKEETPLPLVIAKGEDEEAREIVRTAREKGTPIVRNIPLARALLAESEVDEYIPRWLIEPVAELLRTVAELAEQGPVDEADMD